MKTIRRSSFVLRRIALAGLGAASLWTTAPAHAAIAPSAPAVLGGLQAAGRAPVLPDALPLGKAPLAEPLLVAPRGCGSRCGILFGQQTPTATQRPAEPQALPETILVAPTCGHCLRGHGDPTPLGASTPMLSTTEGSSLILAGGDPPTVVDSRQGPPRRG